MFNKLSEIQSFDAVVVDASIMSKIRKELYDSNKQLPFLGILTEGVIKYIGYINNSTLYIYFKELENSQIYMEPYICYKNRKGITRMFSVTLDFKQTKDRYKNLKFGLLFNKSNSREKMEMLTNIQAIYMGIFGYIHMIQMDSKVEVQEIKKENKYLNSNKKIINTKVQSKNIINIDQIKIITGDVSTIINALKKQIERKTDTWTVRGHYRTLKNGKKIFIKSYIKGKKNCVKPKEYKL